MANHIPTSYPYYYLKFYLNGKMVNYLSTTKILRVRSRIRACLKNFQWNKATIKVRYSFDYHNTGVCFSQKELDHALNTFQELLPEFTEGKL